MMDVFIQEKPVVNVKIIWRCVRYEKNKCHGRYHISSNNLIKHIDKHNPVPNVAKYEGRKVIEDMETRALTSQVTTK